MAPTVGQILRETRTERGIELSEVERVTKVRVKFLLAMEQDQWESLPAPAYARGFLAAYARFLGLDGEQLVDRYRREFEKGEWVDPVPRTVIHPGSLNRPRSARPGALMAAALVALFALVLVLVVSLGGGSGTSNDGVGGKESRGEQAGLTSPSTTSATTTTTTAGTQVSLELRATDLVWVCVVDERDDALINGETLSAGEARGPFTSRGFALNLGNGSVALTVDGQSIDVPDLAEPLGYRVTPEGVRTLAPPGRPTCT